jgi:hypothetical protein
MITFTFTAIRSTIFTAEIPKVLDVTEMLVQTSYHILYESDDHLTTLN